MKEKMLLDEIVKELKWYERIIVRIYRKLFISVYHKGRMDAINDILKKRCSK